MLDGLAVIFHIYLLRQWQNCGIRVEIDQIPTLEKKNTASGSDPTEEEEKMDPDQALLKKTQI